MNSILRTRLPPVLYIHVLGVEHAFVFLLTAVSSGLRACLRSRIFPACEGCYGVPDAAPLHSGSQATTSVQLVPGFLKGGSYGRPSAKA